MPIRPFRPADTEAVVRLAAACARSESDFVLNPLWETEQEFHAEFTRHGIAPEEHLWVADAGGGEVQGLSGYLRPYGADAAGLFCPVVDRTHRGEGRGGELLRTTLEQGHSRLGIRLATAGIGTRNRAGYSLLTAHGFRAVRQHYLMRCDGSPRVGRIADGLSLEAACQDDAAAIHAIYRTCGFDQRSREQTSSALGDGRHAHAVARRGDEVVAFVELETHWATRCWVSFVGVEPSLRDRGLGSALVAWAVAQRFAAGAHQALLVLSPANRTAVRAYEKVGFRRVRLFDVLEKEI